MTWNGVGGYYHTVNTNSSQRFIPNTAMTWSNGKGDVYIVFLRCELCDRDMIRDMEWSGRVCDSRDCVLQDAFRGLALERDG